MVTPEDRAKALADGWYGKQLSRNQMEAGIAASIREAVSLEREACAAVVAGFVDDPHEGWFAKGLADAIRTRGGPMP